MAKLKFKIENIGPLKTLASEFESKQLKVALFATNGSGKTFIGRCFNLLSDLQQDIEEDNFKRYINFDSTEASFLFDFSDSKNFNRFNFKINQNCIIEKSLDSNFIIHVFNEEFVNKNVVNNNYAINSDNITGEILIGNENINIEKEKQELQVIESSQTKLISSIEREIDKYKTEITKLGIRSNLTEYTQINYENILSKKSYNGISFERAKENYSIIKNIPENLKHIDIIKYTLDSNLFEDIKMSLNKTISVSAIGETFKQKILPKVSFIKLGLQLLDEDKSKCPFCESPLKEKSDLINMYIEYFEQEESKFEENLQNLKIRLKAYLNDINNIENDYSKAKLLFYEQKKYFVDLKDIDLPNFPNKDSINNAAKQIETLLKEKSLNNNKTNFSFNLTHQIEIINKFINDVDILKNELNNQITNIERKKSDILIEQQKSRREICLSAIGDIYNHTKQELEKIKILDKEIESKKIEIYKKQSKNKKNKKDKINETFEKYLKMFFNNKYTFNKDKHCLLLNEHLIESNAEQVLSEGEKNIIGFCYYLALTYNRINTKQDCQNLLFIIDDPISSMDYHYVYQVADIIRNIGNEMGCPRFRFIILTHNYEFFNLLLKNNISKLNLILSKNTITELKQEIILPYNEHLKIVNNIANGLEPVSFHTPNSMRHILETICNFSSPNKELKTFIAESDILSGNEYLYTTINDLSHGAIRSQKPYTDEDLKDGCIKIIEYIKKMYPDQLSEISSEKFDN